jgi:hypothetical protein
MNSSVKISIVAHVRLIGRLFFLTCARRLILRSFAYAKVFSFMQNLGQICRFLWAISWTFGQYRGQILESPFCKCNN